VPVKRALLALLTACIVLAVPRVALAHALLVSSTPAANATVRGPDVAIELKYNSRLDGQRSTLTLVLPDGKTQALTPEAQRTPTTLDAHATLQPGHYTLRWQALSTDGHITRGEIPFTVQ
jgi:copper resistance protein C